MNTYTVTITLPTEKAFLKFLDDVGPVVNQMVLSIERAPDTIGSATQPFAVKQAAPRQRNSKVNAAILGALESSNRTVKELKEALEAAGLAASSLSTGLSVLQKAGTVIRHGEGLYGLAAAGEQAKAAE